MSIVGTFTQSSQFSPQSIPGLSLWLDGKDSKTVFQDLAGMMPISSSGQTIRSWKDKSGRGCNATQSGNAPVWNSSGSLTFAHASSQFLRLPDATLPSSSVTGTYSIFAVANPTVASRSLTILCSGSAGTNQFNGLQIQSDGKLGNLWFNNDVGGGSVALNDFFLGNVNYDGANRTVFVAGSNVNTTAGTGWAGTISNNVIGIESATNNWGFSGEIGELVVYSNALTTSQRQTVEGYLARKWNLTSIAGHPYQLGGSGILPTTIPGCLLWLDAADASTLTLSSSNVTQWNDKSGNANHFTVRSGTPTYVSNEVVIPSGTVMRSTASITMSSNVYAVVVFRLTSTAGGYVISFPNMSPGGYVGDYSIRTDAGILNGTPAWPYGNEGDFGGQGNYYVNGFFNPSFGSSTYNVPVIVSAKSMNLSMSGSTTIEISTTSMAPRYFVGCMDEMILYSSPPSTIQRQQLEGYLANKWGITPSLQKSVTPYAASIIPMRPFSPLDVGTCSLWLDGADRSTMTFSGSNVTQWNDKSGNGYNVTSVGTGSTVSSNGLVFTGAGLYSGTASYLHSPTNGTRTFFAVFTASSTSTGNPRILNYPGFGQWLYIESTRFNSYVPPQVSGSVVAVNTPYVAGVVTSTTTTTIYVNGVVDASVGNGTPSTSSGGTFYVAGMDTGAGDRFYGTLSEVLAFSNALGSGDRQQVEAYLAGKWGLQGRMGPSVHPYRYGPAAITPASIPNLRLWLDAADASTLTLSGSNVTAWADKSGQAFNFTTVTTAKPTYNNSIVTFPGEAVMRSVSSLALTTSTFAVVATKLASGGCMLLAFDNIRPAASDGDYSFRYFSGVLSVANTSDFNTNYIVNGASYTSSSNVYLAPHIVSASSSANGTTTVTLSSPFTGRSYIGDIYEVLLYSSVPTTAQRQQLEGYLAWKWGMPSILQGVAATFPRLYRTLLPNFVPLHTADCALWLDGADRTSMKLLGSNVTQWNDKSGNGRNAVVSSNAYAVLTSTGLSFNNSFYTTSYSAAPANETFFVVFTAPASLAGAGGLIGTQTGGRTILTPGFGGTSNAFGVNASGVYGGAGVSGIAASTRSLGVIRIAGTSTTAALNGNSLSSSVTVASFTANTTTTLGRETATLYPFNGVVHEVLAYAAALSTAQRQQVEGYLAWKWGLQGLLGGTPHPFKYGPWLGTPTTIPGCLIWLDSADSASVARTGSNVTQWNDKSGNGNHFTTLLGTPTYGTNEIVFPSGGVMRSTASIALTLNTYAVIVFKVVKPSDFAYVLSFTNMSPAGFTGHYSIRTNNGILNGTQAMTGDVVDFATANYFVNGTFNPSFGASTYSVPVVVAAKNVNLTGTTTVELSASVGRYFIGSMYEVILYSSPPTTEQRQQLEGYLAWKWGTSATLPGPTYHPNKTVKP